MSYKFTVAICLLVGLLIGMNAGASPDQATSAIALPTLPTLPASIYPLISIDPKQSDDSDLAPLDAIIGDAHVVALGEAMHTSGGFHDARFRVVRHLIRDKGFRVFTLESPRLTSQPLIDFLDSCRTSAAVDEARLQQAMGSIFSVFASETMKDMLGWMCQFNAAHPSDAVSFSGFDVQEAAHLSKAIGKVLSADGVPPQLSGALIELVHCNDNIHSDVATLEIEKSCVAAVDDELRQLSGAHIPGLAANELELLKLNMRNLRVAIERHYFDSLGEPALPQAYQSRDQAMADVFLTLQALYWKNSRAIIWAHNTHIERDGLSDFSPNGPYHGRFKDMGQFLSERLKDDYKAIGLLAFQLEINWPGIEAVCVTGGQARDMKPAELKLRLLDRPYLIIDTAAMRKKPASFFAPDEEFGYSQASNATINREFDGLIYLQNSQAMTTLGEAACPFIPDWEISKEERKQVEHLFQ